MKVKELFYQLGKLIDEYKGDYEVVTLGEGYQKEPTHQSVNVSDEEHEVTIC